MSFVYNQKEVFRGCSTKSVDLTLSNKLANFYLNNSNPNRQDIEQFCKEADLDFNSAVSYIKERKMQDIRNRNLVFMKFGREYIQPNTEQVKEYENSLTPGDLEFAALTAENQNTFTKLLNKNNSTTDGKSAESEKDSDLLLEEIPKKAQNSSFTKTNIPLNNYNIITNNNNYDYKNKDFYESEGTIKINKKQTQNQNQITSPIKLSGEASEGKTKTTKSATSSTDNSDSEALSSSASLGRLFNNYYQHSFLPSGIQDTKLIHSLILFMKKDLKLELKHEISITLARTSNSLVLQRFLEFEGAEILSNWLHEIKEKIQDLPNYSVSASQNYLNNILLNLLIFCEKLKISLRDLKFSKIGKEVNKIAKLNLDNKEIHSKCVALVNKWKKLVEETKEGKKLETAASSGFEAAAPLKNEEEKNKKADINKSLLKGILNEEAEKPIEIAARGMDAEQDRVGVELLNRKKYHPDKDKDKEREREKDRLRERDREESSFNAHDKNNKKLKREESNFDLENQKRKEREVQQQQQQTVAFDPNRNNINKGFFPNMPIQNNFVYNTIPLGAPIQNPVLSAVGQKKGPLKGILKTSQSTNQPGGALKKDTKKPNTEKKRIKFDHDMVLEKVKIFKLTDEVNAPNISEEEYQKIQQELLKDPTRSYLGDMKFRESHMEKENLLREKEKAKIAKEIFEKMTPEIKITRPLEIYIKSPYEEGEEIDKELMSEEKEQIDQFLNKILMTTYFRESDIPPTPKMGKSELFEFFDENIPKIENLKTSFDSEKPIYEVDFSKIDHIESNPELLKSLAERINNAELSIQSEEEKNKLLAILQNQMKRTEESNKIATNNPINPLITQLPNLMPSNAINPLNPLAAGNMLNIMKINPNTMGNQIQPNIPNQMFPPIQHMGMGPMPMVPQFNQMNSMMNPNNMMNMNNMNLYKNNMNFPNNPNFNMPNNPNMMNNPMMKNMTNNMTMNSNFNNRDQNNMMKGPGNRMNMNYNYNNNNPNFNNESRKNYNIQDNRQINFNRIKTKPCRNYHGPVGCPRGDDCYFIHDQENQGRDIPEPRLAEIAKTNMENANNNSNNVNNQNNSFYNNNVQNNRFRNNRNFNNRNNSNFSNNRFIQNQQGNNQISEANSGMNAQEEIWNNNNNPTEDDPNIEMNMGNNDNYNENQDVNENENNSIKNDFNQDAMEIETEEILENHESNKNDTVNSNENESAFIEEGVNFNTSNSNNNNNFKNFNSGSNHQNNFYNNNSNQNNNFGNNSYFRNKGQMHQRNYQVRNFNGNRMNNYNKNMNYHNNNNDNQNNNFPGQQNFNNQQQNYYNMIQQQNKLNGNMPFNNNNNNQNNIAGFRNNFNAENI